MLVAVTELSDFRPAYSSIISSAPAANRGTCSYTLALYDTFANFSPKHRGFLAAVSAEVERTGYSEDVKNPK